MTRGSHERIVKTYICHHVIVRRRRRKRVRVLQAKVSPKVPIFLPPADEEEFIDLTSPPTSPRGNFWRRLVWEDDCADIGGHGGVSKNYLSIPWIVESVANHGGFVCVSGLLYELTIMPISAVFGIFKLSFLPNCTFSNRE